MTPRAWWLGVAILAAAVLVHVAIPRYEWRPVPDRSRVLLRLDRWTGQATWGAIDAHGPWQPTSPVP